MPVPVIVNNVEYQYPSVNDIGWGAQATSWAQAVSQATLQKSGGTFTLTAEVDFGGSFGLKSLYFKGRNSNVSSTGVFRLANGDAISWRNAANNGDLALDANVNNQIGIGTFRFNSFGNLEVNNIALGGTLTASPLTAGRALGLNGSKEVVVSAATTAELDNLSGSTSPLQAQINLKAPIDSPVFTTSVQVPVANASRALAVNGSSQIISATTTFTELNYLSGVTSALQPQINLKAPIDSPVFTSSVQVPVANTSRALAVNGSSQIVSSDATLTELNYVSGVTSAIQTQINTKAPTASPVFTGVVQVPVADVSRALAVNGSSQIISTATTSTELGYVSGVTSAIQTQINTKAPIDSPVFTTVVQVPVANASRALAVNGANQIVSSATTLTELSYLSGATSNIQSQINSIVSSSNVSTDLLSGSLTLVSGETTTYPNIIVNSTKSINVVNGSYLLSGTKIQLTDSGILNIASGGTVRIF